MDERAEATVVFPAPLVPRTTTRSTCKPAYDDARNARPAAERRPARTVRPLAELARLPPDHPHLQDSGGGSCNTS